MFAPLASTMLIAMIVSLAVALTIVPVISEWVLPQKAEREFAFVRRFHDGYLALLDRAARQPRLTLGIAVVTLLAAAALTPLIGTEFMPPLDEGSIAVNIVRLPNASLDGSVQVSTFIEKRLQGFCAPHQDIGDDIHAELAQVLNLVVEYGLWEAELGDAVTQDAARLMQRFIDRHIVSRFCKVASAGQARGP